METCGHPNPDRQAGSLETFLVEWKQLRPNETASLARFLETFLVEWKRFASLGAISSGRSLETFLVEWKRPGFTRRPGRAAPLKPS